VASSLPCGKARLEHGTWAQPSKTRTTKHIGSVIKMEKVGLGFMLASSSSTSEAMTSGPHWTWNITVLFLLVSGTGVSLVLICVLNLPLYLLLIREAWISKSLTDGYCIKRDKPSKKKCWELIMFITGKFKSQIRECTHLHTVIISSSNITGNWPMYANLVFFQCNNISVCILF
jgi:hypothetical protein